ncbi:MAG: nickel-responsive transcriptional regulator NikR [Flavobacteriaceae bacterium]|nr:nickel-responsive transcriptional regulator NikR [Flavobacteriaceae bacterium]
MAIVRFGVSLEEELLVALDKFTEENLFKNRSQAIRHLINNTIVREKWEGDKIVAGSITLVFDHHRRELVNKLTNIQHNYHDAILSSLHFHLEHDLCMEIIAVKGKATTLTQLADSLISVKGIEHGKLTMTKAD